MTPGMFDSWEPIIPLDRLHGPEFPLAEALPSPFSEWVKECAESIQVPLDLPVMLELGLVGAACSKKVQVRLQNGHIEPLNPWVAVALGSGERKSSQYRASTEPVRQWEAEQAENKRHEVAEYRSTVKVLEKALARSEERLSKTDGDRLSAEAQDWKRLAREVSDLKRRPVVAPRLTVDDVTQEKLAEVMAEQGGRILITSSEGGTFDLMAGRYARDGAPNLDLYLKGYTGEDHVVDRVGREARHVPKPLLSMVLTVQPGVLRGLAKRESFRDRGVLGRFWYSVPRGRAGFQSCDTKPVDGDVRAKRTQALLALLNLKVPDEPYSLRFDPKAESHYRLVHDKAQERMRPEGDLAHMTDWGQRIAGGMVRLSGILHMMKHALNPRPWEIPIEPATAFIAHAVMEEYLVKHALVAFGMMGSDKRAELAAVAVDWMKRHEVECFSRAELHASLRRQVENPSEWDAPLQLLADHHYIEAVEAEAPSGAGRRPTPRYEVNPNLYGIAAPIAVVEGGADGPQG